MNEMTHRERALTAMAHRTADRVPVDLGATSASLIHRRVYEGVVQLWGMGAEPDLKASTQTAMVHPGEEFLRRVGADFRRVGPERLDPWRPIGGSMFVDEWGVQWLRLGDGEPGHLLGPLQSGDPSIADIERYEGYPRSSDPGRYAGAIERVRALRVEATYGVVFDFPYGLIRECMRMRGFSEWLTDLLADESRAEAMMQKVLETIVGISSPVLDSVGGDIDVFVWYDDMGFQDRPFMRPELYRRLIKPYHARFLDAVRTRTRARIVMHNDGAIHDLLGDLVDIGVQGLNPVQVSAVGMGDTAKLKAEFGADLVWWGAIDTQDVLPFASPERVRDEVRRRIGDLAPGGGYILAPGHNIQAEVPPANVIAMFEAAAEFGTYPLA